MATLPSGRAEIDSSDLFIESGSAVSLSWHEGKTSIELGLRAGAGIRRCERGAQRCFDVFDGGPAGGVAAGAMDLLGEGWDRTACDGFVERAARDGAQTWDEEIEAVVRFIEVAAREIANLCRGTGRSADSLEGVVHLYRQAIYHETAGRRAEDRRGGVRVELRLRPRQGGWLSRIAAARDSQALTLSASPVELARDLAGAVTARDEATGSAWAQGEMPVILDPRGCGPFVHEIGHLFEPDHARLASRPLRIGERIASEEVTIVDDPRVQDGRGSYRVDDEGRAPAAAILVERGRMVADRSEDAVADTHAWEGHARRASYRDPPIPRLACTTLLAGDASSESILAGTSRGLFARVLRGGNLDPVSGRITLIVSEGFLVEAGECTQPIEGALLVGTAREWLAAIDTVGNELVSDAGAGNCIKRGQKVPVMVGLPTVRIGVIRVVAP